MKNKKSKYLNFLAVIAILFVIIRIALYDSLTVRRYEISSPAVSSKSTFVMISDLHSTYYGKNQEKLTDIIVRYSPAAIFMVGDIADDQREFDATAVLLENLCQTYTCYYVTGNHERWVDYTDDIKKLFESYGVLVLDEGSDPVMLKNKIRLFGIDDPLFYDSTKNLSTALNSAETSDEYFDILLSHRPEFYENYISAGFDLTLCGHAHGGQIRLPPLMNGLYAPNQGFFPKYAGGLYQANNRYMIVSRGLMLNEIPRVFNPPEICVITIAPR